ncbi:MAG: TM1266 family iron-only hydrogenase system putative regulator [Thermotaleaceae bacterium]
METRVAIVGIIVEDIDSVEKLNSILNSYGQYIIGRMGLPYRQKGINIISLAVDAPQDIISALSGKLGKLPGVSTKAVYSKVKGKPENEVFYESTDR